MSMSNAEFNSFFISLITIVVIAAMCLNILQSFRQRSAEISLKKAEKEALEKRSNASYHSVISAPIYQQAHYDDVEDVVIHLPYHQQAFVTRSGGKRRNQHRPRPKTAQQYEREFVSQPHQLAEDFYTRM